MTGINFLVAHWDSALVFILIVAVVWYRHKC